MHRICGASQNQGFCNGALNQWIQRAPPKAFYLRVLLDVLVY